MDNNFEVMKAMNYGYDNPESRKMIDVDTNLLNVAMKTVSSKEDAENLALWASMSLEQSAYQLSLQLEKNINNMSNDIEKAKAM